MSTSPVPPCEAASVAKRSCVGDRLGLVCLPGDEEPVGDSMSAKGSGEPAKRFAPPVATFIRVLLSVSCSGLGVASAVADAGRSRKLWYILCVLLVGGPFIIAGPKSTCHTTIILNLAASTSTGSVQTLGSAPRSCSFSGLCMTKLHKSSAKHVSGFEEAHTLLTHASTPVPTTPL